MAIDRRMGVEGSATWSLLLDAAERLILEEGYAAVTSRQLGKEAGLSPQIAYFYFRTMDDLFEALFTRLAEGLLTTLDAAAKTDEPILAMWNASCDPSQSVLMVELTSLSNHRKGLQQKIAEFGREYNRRQVAIIKNVIDKEGLETINVPAEAIASILENLARALAYGKAYNIASHDQARNVVTDFLKTKFWALLQTFK